MKYIKLFEEINLYHGSGKRFDKFDSSMMNKNSGQDTYGWGFYFTDSEDIAKVYANTHDEKYVYHVTLHKGKTPEQYDFLIFDKLPTNSQLSKIINGLDKENIEIDLSNVKNAWDIISRLQKYFFYSYPMKKQFDYGMNTAKKDTSLFLLRCGIDGMKFPAPKGEFTYENGYDGYNYVVFDENNIHIDKIE